jgi:protein-S-isoprenylcysteine O-methyltransferase Ste14
MTITGAVAAATGQRSGARVRPVPPPLYYAGAFALGLGLRAASVPLTLGGRPATFVAGSALLAAGAALGATGVAAVVRHHTTIVPHRPVSELLTTGAYRLSRNPMYTGLALSYLGAALMVGSAWPMITLPLALLLVRRTVIAPEERYLAERFGADYADYRAGTRRWL